MDATEPSAPSVAASASSGAPSARALLSAAARRLSRRLGTQVAAALVTTAALASVVAAVGAATRGNSRDTVLSLLACIPLIGASAWLHSGIALGLAASRRAGAPGRAGLRLAALGALEWTLGGAIVALLVVATYVLDREVGLHMPRSAVIALVSAAVALPFVLQALSRGWLGLLTARLVLGGDRVGRAVRASRAALVGMRRAIVGIYALISLPAVGWFGLLWLPGVNDALRESVGTLAELLLAIVIGLPVPTMLNAAVECELYERVSERVDAEGTADVFR